MPWCPNCKTEYQDGYTVCSDCGSTLVESLEQAAAEEAAEYIRNAAASFPDDTGFETEEIQETQEETLPEGKELLHDKTHHGVYEGASDKAENFKSGAYTLLTAGIVGLVVVGLLACDLLPIHLTLFSKVATCLVMGTMFIAFIVMGASSYKSYRKHATQAVAESQLKEELVKYCQERLNRELIDQTASVLETESDETAYFKRSAAMKQLISENFLNLDEEYLDHFIDEMYGQIYPNE